MPLVLEARKRQIKSTFYVVPSNKYNCPFKPRAKAILKQLSEEYDIVFKTSADLDRVAGVLFTMEGCALNLLSSNHDVTKITMTYQTDFTLKYSDRPPGGYIDSVDYVMMPSEFIANYYKLNTSKNLYLGITKYDTPLDVDEVLLKYKLSPEQKKAVLVWPKPRDLSRMPLGIIDHLANIGYQVLIKTRGKDPLDERYKRECEKKGHRVFSDESWYPHTTQELIEVSDLVINSGSTMIEECVMHNTPLINFDIKPKVRHGIEREHRVTHDYLYRYPFCLDLKELPPGLDTEQFLAMVNPLVTGDWSKEFALCRQKHLFQHESSCVKVLDFLEETIF
tara:strand:+ start:5250 stop:6257 length:1008 start_codon:yes stop_codon:yes gene_type:complete